MKIGELLKKSQNLRLRPEMEVFLSHLLKCERLDLLVRSEEEVPVELLSALQLGWGKLMKEYPVAYLTNKKEFYGLDFYVDERVLIPRDATEILVDEILKRDVSSVLEIGTGSGAISVALAKTRPDMEIFAGDVSSDALEIASKNIVQNGVGVQVFESDLLADAPSRAFDVLVANLPYIGEVEHRYVADNVEKYEPNLALFGGHDGLDLYRTMFKQVLDQKREFKWIMGEFGFTHAATMRELAEEYFPTYHCEILQDLEGLDRHFILTHPSAKISAS